MCKAAISVIQYSSLMSFSSTSLQCVFINFKVHCDVLPIPVAVRSKEWIWCRSLAGIAGSNPAGTWMSVYFECCQLGGVCDGLITRPEDSTNVVSLAVILKRQ